MEIERQIEILNRIIQYVADIDKFQAGICNALDMISVEVNNDITIDEYKFIKNLIKENKPTRDNQFSKFIINGLWYDGFYWWLSINPNNPDTRQIRINYLNALISSLK